MTGEAQALVQLEDGEAGMSKKEGLALASHVKSAALVLREDGAASVSKVKASCAAGQDR